MDGDELLILKGLITNGTAMSNVTELFEALQANGGGTLSKVLTSAYRRFEAGLEDLPPNTRQFLDEVRRTLRHFLTLIFLKISEDLRKIASEAIEDVDIEAVRKLAIKAVEAYERFVRTVYGGRSDKTRAEVFQDALPGMARFLQGRETSTQTILPYHSLFQTLTSGRSSNKPPMLPAKLSKDKMRDAHVYPYLCR